MYQKLQKQTAKQKIIRLLPSFCLLLAITQFRAYPLFTFAQESNETIPTVSNVENQFAQLKHHGEALGWQNPESAGAPESTLANHYQGLARYPGGGKPVFYVTQKVKYDSNYPTQVGGYLHIVGFGTRPTYGERLRSNLLAKNLDTVDTEPSSADTWIRSIRFDGLLEIDGENIPAYVHPGNMAIVDDILLVPVDTPVDENDPTGQIILFDLSMDKENPIVIQAITLTHSIDNLAVIRQSDDTYLVWVNGDGGKDTRFYETNHTDLRDDELDLDLLQVWHYDWPMDYDGAGDEWPGSGFGFEAHQSSTFLNQTDGTLYLLGMRNELASDFGRDFADLYRVDPKTSPQVGYKLVRISTRHFFCESAAGRICNFAAGPTAFVSPSGQLILYSVPHQDNDAVNPNSVRMGEFRSDQMNDAGACGNLPWGPWAELYDDINFEDRSIVFDWADKDLDDFNDFSLLDGFDEKASSVKWCAPHGCTITMYQDANYGGTNYVLPPSDGSVMTIANIGGWGDNVSSIEFSGTCTPNTPPEVDIGDAITTTVGAEITRGGFFTDPDADIWTATVDYGAGTGPQSLALNPDKTFTLNHAYSEPGTCTYTIIVEVTDSNGNKGDASIVVTVLRNIYLPIIVK